jgi:hypothetical protein
MNVQGLKFLPDDGFRHSRAQVLHQQSHKTVSREGENVVTHTLYRTKDRSVLIAALMQFMGQPSGTQPLVGPSDL